MFVYIKDGKIEKVWDKFPKWHGEITKRFISKRQVREESEDVEGRKIIYVKEVEDVLDSPNLCSFTAEELAEVGIYDAGKVAYPELPEGKEYKFDYKLEGKNAVITYNHKDSKG
jgi:hypothetical protein